MRYNDVNIFNKYYINDGERNDTIVVFIFYFKDKRISESRNLNNCYELYYAHNSTL